MRSVRRFRFALALLPLALSAGPARAEWFEFHSNNGPIRLHVEHGGEARGSYPRYNGELFGHVGADGGIHGIWMQPRSDHPCHEPRGDTYAWGTFYISDPWRRHVEGSWGYCHEPPVHDWELVPR